MQLIQVVIHHRAWDHANASGDIRTRQASGLIHIGFIGLGDRLLDGLSAPHTGAGGGGNPWTLNRAVDLDWRRSNKTFQDALDEAFNRTGVSRGEFTPTKWGKDKHGKSFPTEYRVLSGSNRGAEVSVDLGHVYNGPSVPHVGYQGPGKRRGGGTVRGHILLDDVPYNRPTR